MKNVDTAMLIPAMAECIHLVPVSKKRVYAGVDTSQQAYKVQNDGSNLDKQGQPYKCLLGTFEARMKSEAEGKHKAIRRQHAIATEAPGKGY